MKYDTIIIGGGHNGLVCAAYLARSGKSVLVLERRSILGGACVTEELWPGYKVSTAAYVVSLLLPEIERELELNKYGYEVLTRTPSSFTPFDDGRALILGADDAANQTEISKFSTKDAEVWPDYESLLRNVAEKLEPILSSTPPDLLPLPKTWRRRSVRKTVGDTRKMVRLYKAIESLGEQMPEAIELLTGAARPILDRWFESEELKGTLATDAIIGNFQSVSAPGTAYVLLHHVMGAAGGARGVWGYVKGGMGCLSEAIASAGRNNGVEIRTDAAVSNILVDGNRVRGVQLEDGSKFEARNVASGIDARHTFSRLLAHNVLPAAFQAAVKRIDYGSASMKINLALNQLPNFTAMPGNKEPGPQHRGTIHINAHMQDLEQGWFEAQQGYLSTKPIVEMTIPSAVDPSIAPSGHHVASLFVQFAPYQLANGTWEDHRESFADRCISEIARFAPSFESAVEHRQILTPIDLEQVYGLTGGNIFQGSMSLHQLFSMRPVPGWSDYRTPVEGLYLCGSAAHPGGGVMGASGRNAAQAIMQDGK
ncbi:MAG: NAD(P)/FAD-dependent oxidoreductase [Fuerstiella sp.]|nr:NAD(P)/FAD-dependent oxidoreductase [Fuerstiella sp.]